MSLLQPVSEPSMSGMAEIRVAETEGARERMARSLMTDTLLRLGVLGVGALVLVWLAVSAALRPLDRLRREVEERQPDDLRPLPMLEVQHELRPLVESLNHFTQRLRSLFERQSQFIADAAHELRTRWRRSRRAWNWACASRSRKPGVRPWRPRRRTPTA